MLRITSLLETRQDFMSAILRKANSVQHMNQTVYPSLLGDHVKCQSPDNLGRKRTTGDERHNCLCPPSVSTFNSMQFIHKFIENIERLI